MIKKIGILISVVVLIVLITSAFLAYQLMPLNDFAGEKAFRVEQGESVRSITSRLEKERILRSAFAFRVFLYVSGISSRIIPGDYTFSSHASAPTIARSLAKGGVIEATITIPEGWSRNDIAAYVESKGIASQHEMLEATDAKRKRGLLSSFPFLTEFPETASLEGFLFPDTYKIFTSQQTKDIVYKSLYNFDAKVTAQMRKDIAVSGKTLFDTIILASIVEREVSNNADRRLVADIFYRRLQRGMPLQSDATISILTGKKNPQSSLADIAIDSPYNTYANKGLPPGPIANPGLSSIMAAIYPEKNPYWYFLSAPDGTTYFSKTYDEHLAKKRKYLK
ncbi:endolytic transglycosylase MltG [Candidatus Uhrbacteria bacterium]|nr:endolytic transglycosylase MltG [Candidatus Uhrbacteria bacterium]